MLSVLMRLGGLLMMMTGRLLRVLLAGQVSDRTFKGMMDHRMGGACILPGTFFVEMALEAHGRSVGGWVSQLLSAASKLLVGHA